MIVDEGLRIITSSKTLILMMSNWWDMTGTLNI